MPTLTANLTASGYGRSFAENQSVTTDNGWDIGPVTVNAAVAGTLTTRTSDTVGDLTLAAAHGIVDGDRIDIYWTGGSRQYALVGIVAGTTVPITAGEGDVLPAATTAVTVCKVRSEGAQAIVHSNIEGVVVNAPTYATTFVFRTSADAALLTIVLPAGESYIWTTGTGIANPFSAGTVAKVTISHAGTATQSTGGAVYYN